MSSSSTASPSAAQNSSPQHQMASSPPSSPPSEDPEPSKMENDVPKSDVQGVSETMREEEKKMQEISLKEEEQREKRLNEERQKDVEGGKDVMDNKFKALEYLLSQSKLYSAIMLQQMQKQEEADVKKEEKDRKKANKQDGKAQETAQSSPRKSTRAGTQRGDADAQTQSPSKSLPVRGQGKPAKLKKENSGKITDFLKKEELEGKAGKNTTIQGALQEEAVAAGEDGVKPGDIGVQSLKSARQPEQVTGGSMRGYQLEGLEWLISLYENGLNGILADEMGLGKTIQTIAFIAFLREKGINGPFLIAAPLSTTSNWVSEFKFWTPSIPVVLYHGLKQEREDIRSKKLKNPGSKTFPVICTSYEICMNDRKFLANYGWKFIIIDEGHRIKNLNCRLIRELQSYQSANRLLITGTPLQNNLSELWSLLHFLMPDIFDKLESFESWFDFSALKERNGHEQLFSEDRKKSLVTSLHAILKPFLLRRVKADVEQSLPKKREYVLYAPLSTEQQELYDEILKGNSRAYLEDKVFETLSNVGSGANTPGSARSTMKRKGGPASRSSTPNKSVKTSRDSTPATNGTNNGRGKRAKKQQSYAEVSDRKYFKQLEENESSDMDGNASEDSEEMQREKTFALAKKQIAQKKLQNPVMQLRLCCNSPHNFYDPFPHEDIESAPDPDYKVLVSASGKMVLLDRLLTGLLSAKADHKILLFSQFKSQLDILGTYLEEVRNVSVCRIDGSVAAADRQDQIDLFNGSKSHRIFLLSTRAGGQGINLAAADTVILFDSDWNPQQDLQAQDRAHRIGQKRNVIVYRFATRGTVEEVLLEKADGKRRLEKLVIQKGRFRSWTGRSERAKKTTRHSNNEYEDDEGDDDDLAELRGLLSKSDGEKYDFGSATVGKDMLNDADLKVLTDRSDEAYERAEQGLDGGDMFRAVETKRDGHGLLEQMSKQ